MPPKLHSPFEINTVVTLDITGLNSHGDGIGHLDESTFAIFVPNTVPGDRIQAKITYLKRNFAKAELVDVIAPSQDRIRPPCIVADKCGGCQWMAVDYPLQLQSKKEQIIQALKRIGKFEHPIVHDVLAAPETLTYRNKVTYPLGLSADQSRVKAGYYQRGTHKIINLNQCPVQDTRFNPLLKELKQDITSQDWSIYDEKNHQGSLRHLGLRVGRRTGELLITLVSNDSNLPGLEIIAQDWLKKYPNLVGVVLNMNSDRTNRIFGSETQLIAGRSHLTEIFAGLQFEIQSHTFFQVFTEQAEAVLEKLIDALQLTGSETLIDAYCGVGSMTLPLAQLAESVLGIEVQAEAIRQAKKNARLNNITNVRFKTGKVEDVLQDISMAPDVLLLDPPRKGCEGSVIESIQRIHPARVMYLSCNPATLARDLQLLCSQGHYKLDWVQPADFFPQTSHVEALASLSSS